MTRQTSVTVLSLYIGLSSRIEKDGDSHNKSAKDKNDSNVELIIILNPFEVRLSIQGVAFEKQTEGKKQKDANK